MDFKIASIISLKSQISISTTSLGLQLLLQEVHTSLPPLGGSSYPYDRSEHKLLRD